MHATCCTTSAALAAQVFTLRIAACIWLTFCLAAVSMSFCDVSLKLLKGIQPSLTRLGARHILAVPGTGHLSMAQHLRACSMLQSSVQCMPCAMLFAAVMSRLVVRIRSQQVHTSASSTYSYVCHFIRKCRLDRSLCSALCHAYLKDSLMCGPDNCPNSLQLVAAHQVQGEA